MKMGWVTLLSLVPWKEVIANAPKVADGAKKLWRSVAGSGGDPTAAARHRPQAATPLRPEDLAPQAMASRIADLDAMVDDLRAQMLASANVVKQLAEQNSELIKRIEANRVRMKWMSVISVVSLLVAIAAWANQA